MIVRTRFAPSPTGNLHLGSIRTALFSWLYARHMGGEFILRIEDTDQERSTKEAIDIILESMDWLGLNYEEGPFYQSKRLERYREVADQFIDAGLAYRCNCSKERIDDLRAKQLANKQKPRYDGHCRNKNLPHSNEPYVVRFKNPEDGVVTYDDLILGQISFQNSELDDLVIMRPSGFPTFNFCVVVDDFDMKISHVIRGADHVNNTPRQINIFRALNATPPVYGHVPLILGSDGKLLAKRHGARSVLQYRDDGFLPEAMLNYLVRLGWSHGDQEIFSREEMIKLFDAKDINKAAAAFNQDKLIWLNRHYLKTLAPESLVEGLKKEFADQKIDCSDGPSLVEVIKIQRERSETLREIAAKSHYFYQDFSDYESQAKKHLTRESVKFLAAAKHRFEILPDWTDASLHQILEDVAKEFELKLGVVAQAIRVAMTGSTISPPLNITLRLIGKKRVLERMARALAFIS
ncbi:MAG: glutamate--tRNA ligase [Gammaproteobacteria bacterium]|nr:glutamate--tRNA ligase [Gammaproteobacteria bacterium]